MNLIDVIGLPKEFRPLVPPSYREAKIGDWEIKIGPTPKRHYMAYFRQQVLLETDNWVLFHKGKVWMSLTPMELESQGYHARLANGRVLVCGLGMGALVFNLLQNPRVTHVTVVDNNPVAFELLTKATTWFRQSDKLTAVFGDATALDKLQTYKPRLVDTLLVDIWQGLGEKQAEEDTKAIQAQMQATQVGWWGQELDALCWCRAQRKRPPVSASDLKEYQQYLGFKLMGVDQEFYAELTMAAGYNFAYAYQQRNKQ